MGQFDLVYRAPLDVRGGELPVLPLSVYGALAMSHAADGIQSEGLAAADEFFIYKFNRCTLRRLLTAHSNSLIRK